MVKAKDSEVVGSNLRCGPNHITMLERSEMRPGTVACTITLPTGWMLIKSTFIVMDYLSECQVPKYL